MMLPLVLCLIGIIAAVPVPTPLLQGAPVAPVYIIPVAPPFQMQPIEAKPAPNEEPEEQEDAASEEPAAPEETHEEPPAPPVLKPKQESSSSSSSSSSSGYFSWIPVQLPSMPTISFLPAGSLPSFPSLSSIQSSLPSLSSIQSSLPSLSSIQSSLPSWSSIQSSLPSLSSFSLPSLQGISFLPSWLGTSSSSSSSSGRYLVPLRSPYYVYSSYAQ